MLHRWHAQYFVANSRYRIDHLPRLIAAIMGHNIVIHHLYWMSSYNHFRFVYSLIILIPRHALYQFHETLVDKMFYIMWNKSWGEAQVASLKVKHIFYYFLLGIHDYRVTWDFLFPGSFRIRGSMICEMTWRLFGVFSFCNGKICGTFQVSHLSFLLFFSFLPLFSFANLVSFG